MLHLLIYGQFYLNWPGGAPKSPELDFEAARDGENPRSF